jgi:chemosensory pili system protein ChpA (sensor histidine kinase/response regulator)
MISHRLADSSPGPLNDDLALALQRIQFSLDAYAQDRKDPATLAVIIEAIDQLRSPLEALKQHSAAGLLNEMRFSVAAVVTGRLPALDVPLLRQATECLANSLASVLVDNQPLPAGPLVALTNTLQQARLAKAPTATDDPSSVADFSNVESDIAHLADSLTLLELPELAFETTSKVSTDNARPDEDSLIAPDMTLTISDKGDDRLPAGITESAETPATSDEILSVHWPEPNFDLGGPAISNLGAEPPDEPEKHNAVDMPTLTNVDSELQTAGSESTAIPAQSEDDLSIEWSKAKPAADEPVSSSVDAEPSDEPEQRNLLDVLGLTDADQEFVEVFMEEARSELGSIREQLVTWQQHLGSREALTTIRRAFHTLKGSGRMVGATVIGDFAWEFEDLLNQMMSGTLHPSTAICDAIGESVVALSPLVGETPLRGNDLAALPALAARAKELIAIGKVEPATMRPSRTEPTTTRPSQRPVDTPALPPVPVIPFPSTPATEIDPEFLEVFLEEAREELATIHQQSAIWQQHLTDRQAQTNIRRAFHTLKGSGRVVGATEIGDFAWEFENLLNQVLSGTAAPSGAMIDLISEAVTILTPLADNQPVTHETRSTMTELVGRIRAFLQAAPAAEMAALPEEEPSAPITDRAPPSVAEPSIRPAVIVPAPRLVPPTPVTGMAPPPTPVGVDLELAEVFQYEAAEILDASDLILQRLASETEHTALLNDLRRNMHTLKGGSRMSDLLSIGDLAHAAESVLDSLGKGAGHATPVVLDAIQQTLDRLNRMVAEAAGGAKPRPAIDIIGGLHHLADSIVAGKPLTEFMIASPAVEALAQEPTSQRQAAAPSAERATFQTMTELDQELVQVFQVEASEILDSSDVILQRLRIDPSSTELLNNLRREMHTLKGSSRMAGFMTVGELAHAAESILDGLGKGTLKSSSHLIDLLQRALDRLQQMLAGVLSGEQLPPQRELIEELQSVFVSKPAERSKPLLPSIRTTVTPAATAARPAEKAVAAAAAAAAAADNIRVSSVLLNNLVNQMGESSIFRARVDQGVGAMSFNLGELEQTIARLRRQVGNLATQAEARIQSRQDQDARSHQQEFDPLELDRFTELQQVSRSLMEIADDLGNIGTSLGDHAREVTSLLDQQGKVNKDIQQSLMRTGMVRFGSVVSRLRRVVRQSAQELGKRAELLVSGEDAEVDRVVLESMIAPLEHMLRNSLAHGIESPEVRRQHDKPEMGTITLGLRREGAELVLELSDDGAGLNFAAIRAKGEEKGLLQPEEPASPEDLIALLLRPGFSTASSVTQIAGRGVGMDVVNEAIRAMRGALLIQTDPGQGTRFIIRLPFSLAVTQALLAQVGESLYAIPLLSIELVIRLQESEFQAYLSGENVQHQYGERHYPIHNLGLLTGSGQIRSFEEVTDRRPPTLLFRSAEASAALQVEAVLGNREIIVKPVGPQFHGVPGISGATVLADGRVVVVLELAALVRNIGSQAQKQLESRALRNARQETRQEKITIMVIDDSITMRKVTARILERHNIQVTTAKDGLDAVAMLQTQVPDLAILDIEMPRMDGFEVIAHVRNQPNLRHMPIIMVTSRGGDKHRERAMNLGVNDYLTKPYQEDQLMHAIRTILGERALALIS